MVRRRGAALGCARRPNAQAQVGHHGRDVREQPDALHGEDLHIGNDVGVLPTSRRAARHAGLALRAVAEVLAVTPVYRQSLPRA